MSMTREQKTLQSQRRCLAALKKAAKYLPMSNTDPVVVAQGQTFLRALAAHVGLRGQ